MDTVNVRLPRELWEAIRVLAERDRRSVTAQLVVLLEAALAADRKSQRRAKGSQRT